MALKIWYRENGWRRVIVINYGCQWGDWCSHSVPGPYGVSLWKTISKGWDRFSQFVSYKVGDGSSIKFWTDRWCGETFLRVMFPYFIELLDTRMLWFEIFCLTIALLYIGMFVLPVGLRIGKWILSLCLWSCFTQ
jgi:hypothetical protein